MKNTQHFHPANLQFLAIEARQDAKEFPQRPAQISQPKFTSAHSPAVKFLMTADHAAERLALALRSVRRGSWLGFGQNPVSGTPVAVVCRQAPRKFTQLEA